MYCGCTVETSKMCEPQQRICDLPNRTTVANKAATFFIDCAKSPTHSTSLSHPRSRVLQNPFSRLTSGERRRFVVNFGIRMFVTVFIKSGPRSPVLNKLIQPITLTSIFKGDQLCYCPPITPQNIIAVSDIAKRASTFNSTYECKVSCGIRQYLLHCCVSLHGKTAASINCA